MLILSRKENQRIIIDDNIVLVVLGIENNRVKLGLEAPSEVAIVREELLTRAKDVLPDTPPLGKTGTD